MPEVNTYLFALTVSDGPTPSLGRLSPQQAKKLASILKESSVPFRVSPAEPLPPDDEKIFASAFGKAFSHMPPSSVWEWAVTADNTQALSKALDSGIVPRHELAFLLSRAVASGSVASSERIIRIADAQALAFSVKSGDAARRACPPASPLLRRVECCVALAKDALSRIELPGLKPQKGKTGGKTAKTAASPAKPPPAGPLKASKPDTVKPVATDSKPKRKPKIPAAFAGIFNATAPKAAPPATAKATEPKARGKS